PSATASATFPAVRTTKRSPRLWSKINSGPTRLSEHERMIASGDCPEASLLRSATSARTWGLPATNRLLPAIRMLQTRSAERPAWLGACDECCAETAGACCASPEATSDNTIFRHSVRIID